MTPEQLKASILQYAIQGKLVEQRPEEGTGEELYRQMNGMPLREMDKIVYPVCKLCRDHERSGFVEGIKIGVRLRTELTEE